MEVDSREKRRERLDLFKRFLIYFNDFYVFNKCRMLVKNVLVKNGICFKCCNLVEYFFKNCF